MTDSPTQSALSIKSLVFSHHDRAGASFDLNIPQLSVAVGEHVLLTGPSGSGKSTLLQLISGLLEPASGSITVAGQSLGALHGAELDAFRGRNIGMIFQTFNLLAGFTALENVLMALMFSDLPPSQHRIRANELLARLGIERTHAMPDQLSVGQQQRVAVARALATRPKLVLADEPTASLDAENSRNAIELIRDTCREEGAALVCTSHDPSLHAAFERVEELFT
ncbi:MAG: ABC transporter ATP-binding protein [Planctomycetota bacterium]|nr:ABC transporter ATP-binding protein [Planctomycetota bacterium]